MKDDYKRISKFYNLLSCLYSFGAVGRCRNFVLEQVKPGLNVCFLGVGQGREAMRAIEMGANITVVDSSQSMLDHFQKRLVKTEVDVKIYHGDVIEFYDICEDQYDLVVSNFFLNVFSERQMPEVLERLLGLCNPLGKMVIGDFWYDERSSKVVQWIQKTNWNLALFLFRRLANNPKHEIYVYDSELEVFSFEVVTEKTLNVLGIPMYKSMVAKNSAKEN